MTMLMRGVGSLLVAVHDSDPPTDEEWRRWLDLCDTLAGRKMRCLVESDGGGPNAKQRKALVETLRGRDTLAAILTDSAFHRGVVTAIAWLGLVSGRAFPKGAHEDAVAYLELTPQQAEQLRKAIDELREALRSGAGQAAIG